MDAVERKVEGGGGGEMDAMGCKVEGGGVGDGRR